MIVNSNENLISRRTNTFDKLKIVAVTLFNPLAISWTPPEVLDRRLSVKTRDKRTDHNVTHIIIAAFKRDLKSDNSIARQTAKLQLPKLRQELREQHRNGQP